MYDALTLMPSSSAFAYILSAGILKRLPSRFFRFSFPPSLVTPTDGIGVGLQLQWCGVSTIFLHNGHRQKGNDDS